MNVLDLLLARLRRSTLSQYIAPLLGIEDWALLRSRHSLDSKVNSLQLIRPDAKHQ